MEPLLRTLAREEGTMRTRQIKEGEDIKSLWDTVMDERNEYRLFDVKGKCVTCRDSSGLARSPYLFYSEANAVEDEILFPDKLGSREDSAAFREIGNCLSRSVSSTARHLSKGFEATSKGKDPRAVLEAPRDSDEDRFWALPKIWTTSLKQVHKEPISEEQRQLLRRTGLARIPEHLSLYKRLETCDKMEVMDRERAPGNPFYL